MKSLLEKSKINKQQLKLWKLLATKELEEREKNTYSFHNWTFT